MVNNFNKICDFRRENLIIKGNPIKSNDELLNEVKSHLLSFRNKLSQKYSFYNGHAFTVSVSIGITTFPNILHICILPPKQKVSNGIYTAICFDKSGNGALVGCAESKTNPMGLNTVKRKHSKKKLLIDVDGGRPTTKYNDVYENPKEFIYNEFAEDELIEHIEKSLDLCLYNLKLVDSFTNLQARDYLNSHINEDNIKFLPDENDDRKKIAIQINARRGQRKFRAILLKAYNGKCAVTECNMTEILEAAHIFPYKGDHTNHIQNGILLRSDIHTLFDLGQISVNADNYKIKISKQLSEHEFYKDLDGKILQLPQLTKEHPDRKLLKYHYLKIFIE